MKNLLPALVLFIFCTTANAQFQFKPLDTSDPNLPEWAKMMYGTNPNVFAVERAYKEYYKTHEEEKTPYTGYYNNWRRYIQPFVQEDGSIKYPTQQEREAQKQLARQAAQSSSSSNFAPWQFVGPTKNYRARYGAADPVAQISWHANMYCIDRSMTNPNVLYAGGENGGVYKTTDQALNWQYISLGEDMTTVSSIAVNPTDENDVLVNADSRTYRTTDGGLSWTQVGSPAFQARNVSIWQFLYNPDNTQIVFAGANDSLYKSTDGGNTWSGVYGGECMSIALNPLNSNIVYALRHNSVSKITDFYKSTDGGLTFTIKPTGWFTVPVADVGKIESYGGRIAVTEADTSRLYVLLAGSSQSTAQLQLNGQIGIYRSDDGGESWSNPHGLIGMPYDVATHPNMMTFSGGTDTYNQIYYNTTLIASQLDADRILIGGMSMWRSDDAAATYQPVGGYIGSVPYIHPDNQEFKVYKTSPTTEEVWFSSDGGIDYSTDFVATHESRANGVYGTALWGFDQGWNDDILVGGRYHNGNAARRDGYPAGEFLQVGGGEAATGYVNYSNEKKTYYSDIDGVILPDTLNGLLTTFPINEDPNESYIDNSSSRIMFDWDYWNVAYLGQENRIMKSTNGGTTYEDLYAFGSDPADRVFWIEQSRADKNVMYAQQVVGNISQLWKSLDRGVSWTQITLPQNRREVNFTLSYNNANEFWICFNSGANMNKVYHTVNSGTSWTNITTNALNGFTITAMAHQFGTDGGVYLATYHGPVFYRNNTMATWTPVGTNIPAISYPLRIVPFYRDNKIRLATWQLGIWDTQLYEPSELVADFSANYSQFYCPGDTISFVPHSVSSSSATYLWTFNGATPATSTAMYPKVVYNSTGTFDVKLVVTDGASVDSITKTGFINTAPPGGSAFVEDFETGSFAPSWNPEGTGSGNSGWAIDNAVGGYALSTHSMRFDNYNYDAQGARDAMWTSKYDLTNLASAWVKFDVAYSLYGGQYSDSLEIAASTDCGQTFAQLYLKGGATLATAPSYTSATFVPLANEWRTDSFDITSLAGYPEVIFAIINYGRFGQVIYADNFNMSNVIYTGVKPVSDIDVKVFPNPFHDELTFTAPASGDFDFVIYDAQSRAILSSKLNGSREISTGKLPAGVYFYEIKREGNIVRQGKLVKE